MRSNSSPVATFSTAQAIQYIASDGMMSPLGSVPPGSLLSRYLKLEAVRKRDVGFWHWAAVQACRHLRRVLRAKRHQSSEGSIAYTVTNWDAEKDGLEEELKRRGLQYEGSAKTSFHVKDPEGMGVQFGGLHQ